MYSKPDTSETFNESVAVGEEFEQRFVAALRNSFGDRYYWHKHPSCSGTAKHCKCFDFENLTQELITIECKKDWYAKHSSRLCFERYLMDPDILRATHWAHEVWQDTVLWFRVDDLRAGIQSFIDIGRARWFMGGQGQRTEMCTPDAKLFLQHVPHLRLNLAAPLPPDMLDNL